MQINSSRFNTLVVCWFTDCLLVCESLLRPSHIPPYRSVAFCVMCFWWFIVNAQRIKVSHRCDFPNGSYCRITVSRTWARREKQATGQYRSRAVKCSVFICSSNLYGSRPLRIDTALVIIGRVFLKLFCASAKANLSGLSRCLFLWQIQLKIRKMRTKTNLNVSVECL